MELWQRASNYAGEDLTGYRILLSHNRGSHAMDESNWDAAVALVGNLPGVEIHWFSHWAHGWVESLLVHPDAPAPTVKACEEIESKLSDYPLLDGDDYSAREYDRVCKSWESASLRERIEACRKHGLSIFAARCADFGSLSDRYDTTMLWDELRAD